MTGVLGIDPGFRSIGIALPDGRLATIRPDQTDHDARLNYIDGIFRRLLTMHEPVLVMLEGPAPHGQGWQAQATLNEVRGLVRSALFEFCPHRVDPVPPSRLKRWATGNGNADKDRMMAAARQLGHDPRNHDEADAALLRALGLHGLTGDDPFPTADAGHRLDVISNITWPVVTR